MIDAGDLLDEVIKPVLKLMVPAWGEAINHPAAPNLLLGTCFQESLIGNAMHLRQVGGGPALGIYQIEPATHRDIWDNHLNFRPGKAQLVRGLATSASMGPDFQLITNLAYSTAIARIKYWRRTFEWPEDPNDLEALAWIWDTHYNANPIHGKPEDFIAAFPAGCL